MSLAPCWCKLLYNNSQALLSKHQSIDCQDSVTSNMYMQQWPKPVDSYHLCQLKSQPHIRRDTERPSGLLEDRLLRGCMCAAAERIKSAGQFHSNHVLHFLQQSANTTKKTSQLSTVSGDLHSRCFCFHGYQSPPFLFPGGHYLTNTRRHTIAFPSAW